MAGRYSKEYRPSEFVKLPFEEVAKVMAMKEQQYQQGYLQPAAYQQEMGKVEVRTPDIEYHQQLIKQATDKARQLAEETYGGDYGAAQFAVPGFFVLSSFLITLGLLHSLRKKRLVNIKDYVAFFLTFTIKRLFRVYPLYFIVSYYFENLRKYGEECAPYRDLWSLKRSGLCLLWTIKPEMMNYIYVPFFAISVTWHPIFILGWFGLLHYANSVWTPMNYVMETWEAFEARIPYAFHATFLAGSCMAAVYFWTAPIINRFLEKSKSCLPNYLTFLVGRIYDALIMGCIVYMIRKYIPRYSGKYDYDIHLIGNDTGFLIAGVLYLALFAPEASWALYIFRGKLPMFWGKVSYSMYLLHKFVTLHVAKEAYPGWSSLECMVFITAVTTVISYISYLVIEKPFVNLGYRLCRIFS